MKNIMRTLVTSLIIILSLALIVGCGKDKKQKPIPTYNPNTTGSTGQTTNSVFNDQQQKAIQEIAQKAQKSSDEGSENKDVKALLEDIKKILGEKKETGGSQTVVSADVKKNVTLAIIKDHLSKSKCESQECTAELATKIVSALNTLDETSTR